jgi:hypothetical protein
MRGGYSAAGPEERFRDWHGTATILTKMEANVIWIAKENRVNNQRMKVLPQKKLEKGDEIFI